MKKRLLAALALASLAASPDAVPAHLKQAELIEPLALNIDQ